MAQTINTNLASLNAQRNQSTSQASLMTSMQRLSSGLRVNSAKDDAAGLAIAERMNAQVRGMNVAVRNSNDAISMSQTAEGALGKIGDNLQRMRELALQSANATNSDGDRTNLQKEFLELQKEVGRTISGTTFNGKTLFAAGSEQTLTFQVGAGTTANDTIDIEGAVLGGGASAGTVTDLATAYTTAADAPSKIVAEQNILASITKEDWTTDDGIAIGGKNSDASVTADATNATAAVDLIDQALDIINDKRASFGAAQNRFDAVISNLQVNIENQSAARGRIMDADFATETSNLSRAQILQQAGNAMIAQANQLPQQVMKLLQG